MENKERKRKRRRREENRKRRAKRYGYVTFVWKLWLLAGFWYKNYLDMVC